MNQTMGHIIQFMIFAAVLASACVSTKPPEDPVQPKKEHTLKDQAAELSKDGLFRESLSALESWLREHPKDLEARRDMGILNLQLNEYKKATVFLKQYLQQKNDDYLAHYYLGEAYRATDKLTDAIFHYQSSFKLNPKFPSNLKSLAWSYYRAGFYKKARKMGILAYKHYKHDYQVAIILARTLIASNEIKKGRSILKKHLDRANPSEVAFVHSTLGTSYLSEKKCQEAAHHFVEALKIEPLLSQALAGIGRCELALGQKEKAIDHLERALKLRPQQTETYFYLGQAYWPENKIKAVKYLAHFVRNSKDNGMLADLHSKAKYFLAQAKKTP